MCLVSDQISASVADGVGHVTLDRPQALNALSYEMIRALTDVFEALARRLRGRASWCSTGPANAASRPAATSASCTSTRPTATPRDAREFFRSEYRLDAMIARYPKPVVAIMDGITMGGGIGLAGHAAIRVVTERSRVAMPETRIGFTPDVGGSWLLARAPGELGVHLALNSRTMDAADALHAGFADSFVPSERLPHLVQALAERADPGSPAEIVMLFDETPGPSALALARDWVDACYSAPTVAEIITRLRAFAEGRRDARVELVPGCSRSTPRHPPTRPPPPTSSRRSRRPRSPSPSSRCDGPARWAASRRRSSRSSASSPGSSSSTTCARASARRSSTRTARRSGAPRTLDGVDPGLAAHVIGAQVHDPVWPDSAAS